MTDVLEFEVIARTEAAEASLERVSQKLEKTGEEVKKTTSGFSDMSKSLGSISPTMRKLTTNMGKMGDAFKKMGFEFGTNGTIGKMSNTMGKMANSSAFRKATGVMAIAAVGSQLFQAINGSGARLAAFDKLNVLGKPSATDMLEDIGKDIGGILEAVLGMGIGGILIKGFKNAAPSPSANPEAVPADLATWQTAIASIMEKWKVWVDQANKDIAVIGDTLASALSDGFSASLGAGVGLVAAMKIAFTSIYDKVSEIKAVIDQWFTVALNSGILSLFKSIYDWAVKILNVIQSWFQGLSFNGMSVSGGSPSSGSSSGSSSGNGTSFIGYDDNGNPTPEIVNVPDDGNSADDKNNNGNSNPNPVIQAEGTGDSILDMIWKSGIIPFSSTIDRLQSGKEWDLWDYADTAIDVAATIPVVGWGVKAASTAIKGTKAASTVAKSAGATSALDSVTSSVSKTVSGAVESAGKVLSDVGSAIGKAVDNVVSGVSSFFNGIGTALGFAEGGVFMPNSPQLVWMGDNRTEPEVAAPYSMIVSAVKEALSSGGPTQQTIRIEVPVELDGRTIARASYDYIEAESLRRNGSVGA